MIYIYIYISPLLLTNCIYFTTEIKTYIVLYMCCGGHEREWTHLSTYQESGESRYGE